MTSHMLILRSRQARLWAVEHCAHATLRTVEALSWQPAIAAR